MSGSDSQGWASGPQISNFTGPWLPTQDIDKAPGWKRKRDSPAVFDLTSLTTTLYYHLLSKHLLSVGYVLGLK